MIRDTLHPQKSRSKASQATQVLTKVYRLRGQTLEAAATWKEAVRLFGTEETSHQKPMIKQPKLGPNKESPHLDLMELSMPGNPGRRVPATTPSVR